MTAGWTPIAHAESLPMPDLSELVQESGVSIVLLGFRNFLTGHGVPFVEGSHARAYYKNYVRLVDKALRRYESSRFELGLAIDRSPESTAIDHVVRAISDLEDVLNSLHRALQLLDLLKRAPEAPVTSVDLRPFQERTVRRLRHASEHIAGFLAKGEIGSDEDVMLRAWGEGITFAGESISYATLATWLTRLHHTARGLVDHDSLAGQRPTVMQVEPN